MKKAKLFMMLALLVMGVSNVFAVDEDGKYHYRVIFEDGVINGGYTVKPNSGVTTGDNAYVLESENEITADNYSTFITLNEVTGNNEGFVIDVTPQAQEMGFDGVIYITYQSTVAEQTSEDTNYTYSNIYTRTDGRTFYFNGEESQNPFPKVTSKIYCSNFVGAFR